jgi:hypothetical protein
LQSSICYGLYQLAKPMVSALGGNMQDEILWSYGQSLRKLFQLADSILPVTVRAYSKVE